MGQRPSTTTSPRPSHAIPSAICALFPTLIADWSSFPYGAAYPIIRRPISIEGTTKDHKNHFIEHTHTHTHVYTKIKLATKTTIKIQYPLMHVFAFGSECKWHNSLYDLSITRLLSY